MDLFCGSSKRFKATGLSNDKQKAMSHEQKVKSNEQKCNEQRAKISEQRATSNEQNVQPLFNG